MNRFIDYTAMKHGMVDVLRVVGTEGIVDGRSGRWSAGLTRPRLSAGAAPGTARSFIPVSSTIKTPRPTNGTVGWKWGRTLKEAVSWPSRPVST
jgi:hypothetical protein